MLETARNRQYSMEQNISQIMQKTENSLFTAKNILQITSKLKEITKTVFLID